MLLRLTCRSGIAGPCSADEDSQPTCSHHCGSVGCHDPHIAAEPQSGLSEVQRARHWHSWARPGWQAQEQELSLQVKGGGVTTGRQFFDSRLTWYASQELAEGRSLAQMVQEGWRADEREVGRIAEEVLRILEYLGQRRPAVTHRWGIPECQELPLHETSCCLSGEG